MSQDKIFYIVSFGNSRKFRTGSVDKIKKIADSLRNTLTNEFKGIKITGFLIPTIDEIAATHKEQYSDLPKLDSEAEEEIINTLREEITNRSDQQQLDLNAPFDEINPDAVAPGQI